MEPATEFSAKPSAESSTPTTQSLQQQESERVQELMKNRRAPSSRPDHCLDCGQAISGRYCANCGQETTAHTLTMRELSRDAIGEFISTDSKFFRTLRQLLFSPGTLTADYIAGRRERYLMPSRMFLVLSVIFFFVISLTEVPFSEYVVAMTFEKEEIQASFQASRLSQEMFIKEVDSAFTAALPIILVLMVPLFAGMMKLINIASKHRFIVHLVFSFHLFSFVAASSAVWFLMVMILGEGATAVGGQGAMEILAAVMLLVVVLYLLIYTMVALRRVYGYSWIGVFIETMILLVIGGFIGVTYLSMVAGFALGFVEG